MSPWWPQSSGVQSVQFWTPRWPFVVRVHQQVEQTVQNWNKSQGAIICVNHPRCVVRPGPRRSKLWLNPDSYSLKVFLWAWAAVTQSTCALLASNQSGARLLSLVGRPGRSLQLAVKASREEAESKAGLLSSFLVEKEIFILVEGRVSRLRPTCTFPFCALEQEVDQIIEKAQDLQSSDENVQYATASEHHAEEAAQKKKEELSSSSEEEESESSGDEVFRLFSRAAKVGIEPATGFEKREN